MIQPLLSPDDPPPYEIVAGPATSPILFLCDHASNRVPASLGDHAWDGLLERHIGYDIGAAAITRHLAKRFGAPAILGTYSRLVADLNRFPVDPTFSPEISDKIAIPANKNLCPTEHQSRIDNIFAPYHCRVEIEIDRLAQDGATPVIFLIHSMTPKLKGLARRSMDLDVMSMTDRRIADPLLDVLSKRDDLIVADNDPYELEGTDYTAMVHCVRRGLPHVQVEFRQDLIDEKDRAIRWADRLGDAMVRSGIVAMADDHECLSP